MLLTATAHAQEPEAPAERTAAAGESPETAVPAAEERAPSDRAIPYEVTIGGTLDEALRDQLLEVSQLIALQDRPPDTAAALRRRLRDDVERLQSVLRSQSYYAGRIESTVDLEQQPARITLTVEPGMEYLLESYRIDYQPENPGPPTPQQAEDLELSIGMRARAQPITRAEDRLLRRLGQQGYPYAAITQRRYVVDHDRTVMNATLSVATGPRTDFGPLEIGGLTDVSETYLRSILEWQPDKTYDTRELERVRRRAIESRLFDTVLLEPPETAPEDGVAPIRLTLRERQHRTISLGGGVTSAKDRFQLKTGWEHRNLFHEGERLKIEATGSLLQQELSANFNKPNYLRLDQALIAETSLRREESDAFDGLILEAFGGLERRLSEHWTGRGGLGFELSQLDDQFGEERFALVGLPLTLTYDTRDDLLNPTEGVELNFGIAPWLNSDNLEDFFIVNEINGSTYWAPFDDDSFVLAVRGRLGSLTLAEAEEVPATKRFYSGGATLRGYEFRSVGPLDEDDDPLGGLSVLEVGLDLRFRVFEDFGIVPFVDGGQVYQQRLPDFGEELQWAAGIGFRYFTPIGPLRLDFAFPINRRQGVDDFFQFYLSIGQAF